ncbi:16S rRNA (uracil(1498)-N(3))-methyltransferase [Thiomonas sp.]
MARLHLPGPLSAGLLDLPRDIVRHVQALRLRVGDDLTLFDGRGGEWQGPLVSPPPAARVELLRHVAVERELPWAVTLAVGMPANERMDWLVEKATELGAAQVQPLMTVRSVLRLDGERAARRAAHWQAVAQAACEQCGRNRLPQIAIPTRLDTWLASLPPATLSGSGAAGRCMLAAPGEGQALPFAAWAAGLASSQNLLALSGPEGGLSADEIALAQRAGFVAVSLGPRVLRAETAPLALLAALAAQVPPH